MSTQDLKWLKANYITGQTRPELFIKVAHYSTPAACMSRTADFFFSKCDVCDQTAFFPILLAPESLDTPSAYGAFFFTWAKKTNAKEDASSFAFVACYKHVGRRYSSICLPRKPAATCTILISPSVGFAPFSGVI